MLTKNRLLVDANYPALFFFLRKRCRKLTTKIVAGKASYRINGLFYYPGNKIIHHFTVSKMDVD
jgi:hypothetical protein